tara:strand:+ start:568 stop:765 length:198 start_codon:yes stop_codon:yes gene_type:complete
MKSCKVTPTNHAITHLVRVRVGSGSWLSSTRSGDVGALLVRVRVRVRVRVMITHMRNSSAMSHIK